MNRRELEEFTVDIGRLQEMVGMARNMLTRTYPAVSCRGSQDGEDEILRDLLPGDGTYIDIGAAEPQQCSNTWLFYERGWRGLLIEPLYWYWPAIIQQRVGDFLYGSAIRNYDGFTPLRTQGTVSSVLPGWNISEQGTLMVPCETTANALAKFPAIRDACRLCSIDVEGAEREVLETIDWATFRPEVFVVEFREYDPVKLGADLSGQWADLLTAQGYKEFARTSLNIIYQAS